MHVKYLFKTGLMILLMLVMVNYAGFWLLQYVVGDSQFRLAVAGNSKHWYAGKEKINLFMGDSRVMGGINSIVMNQYSTSPLTYNLAYNGLKFSDNEILFKAFERNCDCRIGVVFLNAYSLPGADGAAGNAGSPTDVQVFLSAFDDRILDDIDALSPGMSLALRLFPVLHFNNELFLRSLYYRISGKTDQTYSNNYRFKVNPAIIKRLENTKQTSEFDVDRILGFRNYLRDKGTRLVILIPPYHQEYIERVEDFSRFTAEVARLTTRHGVEYHDHSRHFYDDVELFSDPMHLNRSGQIKYTKFFAEHVNHIQPDD